MAILNYTTEVDVMKTIGLIHALLVAKGASTIRTDYENGEPKSLFFAMNLNGQQIPFRLPCNAEGVYKAMQKDRKIPPRYKNVEQSKRVAWRILKDWVEAQMAFFEAGQADMAEIFMPYAVMRDGQTLYQYFQKDTTRLLCAAPEEHDERRVIQGEFGRQ